MIRRLLFICLLLNSSMGFCQEALDLWYEKPAQAWEEANPLGNGKMGAMVFGGVQKEHFQINDNTLWTRQSVAGNNPQAAQLLPLLRERIFQKNYTEAEAVWRKMQGPYSSSYLPLGDLWLDFDFPDSAKVTKYKRTLSLANALHTTRFTLDGVEYTRESFISHPTGVMAIKISSSKPKKLNFTVKLDSKLRHKISTNAHQQMTLEGHAPYYVASRSYYPDPIRYDETQGMHFAMRLQAKNKGGKIELAGNTLKISQAHEVILFVSTATSFNGFDKDPISEGKDPKEVLSRTFQKLDTYQNLKKEHLEDYHQLFNRVKFQLKSSHDFSTLSTQIRLKNFNTSDLGLQTLYYQFGRYLMISGSRKGGRPMNLQGIWNDKIQPPWRSNYTLNINTEMNYWPAESTNLSECHQPLLQFISELAQNGATTAKINYGINEGWLAHHNSDIWAITTPSGDYDQDKTYYPGAFAWYMGGAWLSLHLWERFLFTQNRDFLKSTAYPLMKGAAQFMLHWLVKDPATGYWITNPSTSPENSFNYQGKKYYLTKGTTMDLDIIRELFQAVASASEILEIDSSFRNKIKTTLKKLYPHQIGQYGQLQEWFEDYDDPKDTHRHISQLFGLYPGTQLLSSGPLLKAAQKTLENRGDEGTGWSMAWKINWWARLANGNRAHAILQKAFTYINPADTTVKMSGGGTYPNLLDAHPPFQIDGNFGAIAGMTEMLLQSHLGEIKLLPALPDAWPEGYIEGIKARGNFEVSLYWKKGQLVSCKIKSLSGGLCKITYSSPIQVKNSKKAHKTISILTQKGKIYEIVPEAAIK